MKNNRAVEAVGLAPKGEGGKWIEKKYNETMKSDYDPNVFPVNTHGGVKKKTIAKKKLF